MLYEVITRSRIVDKKVVECDPGFGAAPWQGALAALEPALAPLLAERVDATVVLSNHFVRYAVVKPETTLSGEEEALGHARFHFTRVYGERARGWDLRRITSYNVCYTKLLRAFS